MPTDATRRASRRRCAFARSGASAWRTSAQVQKAGFDIEAVVADADYGTTTAFRTGLERMGLRYAVAVRGQLKAWAPGATTARTLEAIGQALPRRRVATGHMGARHQGAAGGALRRSPGPTPPRSRRAVGALRTVAGRRRTEVLRPQPRADRVAEDTGPARAQPLADRTAVPGTERRTGPGPLRRAHVSRLGAPHGADRRRVHVPAIRTASVASRRRVRPCPRCGRGCGRSWRFSTLWATTNCSTSRSASAEIRP